MLQAAANTAPTGVYVCGHTSTAAGLTVSQSYGCLRNHKTSLHMYVFICVRTIHTQHRFVFNDSKYLAVLMLHIFNTVLSYLCICKVLGDFQYQWNTYVL